MNAQSTSSLVLRDDLPLFDVQLALGGFLAGYSNNTFLAYQQVLRQFLSWCSNRDLELFNVKRTHIELSARWLERRGAARATIGRRLSAVTGFHRYCAEEGLVDRNPGANVRRPRQRQESTMSGLDRNELGAFLVQAGLSGARDHALACLLALNGLRVSEAIGTDVDDLGLERGQHTLRIVCKGGSTEIAPLAPRTARTVYLAIGERADGPIFRHGLRRSDEPVPDSSGCASPGKACRDGEDDQPSLATPLLHHCSPRRRSTSKRVPCLEPVPG